MKYKRRALQAISAAAPAASGANVKLHPAGPAFVPWQPSTWPAAPPHFREDFRKVLEQIFKETILGEIESVINDVRKSNGDLQHRGHVVAIAMLCAVDTLSSYAFSGLQSQTCLTCKRGDRVGPRYKKFIEEFFPAQYKPFATDIYSLYRNAMVHSWNLFEVTIYPANEAVQGTQGALSFGLLNFFAALQNAARDFLSALGSDPDLQASSLNRYRSLKNSARP